MNTPSPSVEKSALVEVVGVEKVFHRGTEEIHVLKGLHLQVPAGEFLEMHPEIVPAPGQKAAWLRTRIASKCPFDKLRVPGGVEGLKGFVAASASSRFCVNCGIWRMGEGS
jgi:hypothetical protein